MNVAGGIGKSIESVEQLEQLQRPLTMETGGIVLMDLLWRCAAPRLLALRHADIALSSSGTATRPKTTASWDFGPTRAVLVLLRSGRTASKSSAKRTGFR